MIDQAGIDGMERCAEKAEAVTSFDVSLAQAHVLDLLKEGPKTGEMLVWLCKDAGHVPHDDRAYGTVFAGLSRRGLIKKIGYTTRHRGHGTSGAIVWALT